MKKIVTFKLIPLMILVLLFFVCCEKEKDSNLPTDGDGNIYDTVHIGTQVWLTENLKTTKYNNGTEIRLVTDNTEWSELELPAYCWYDNDPGYKDTYGALYNWYAGRIDLLCPVGYHVPRKDDWATLANSIGWYGSPYWIGFNALPVGVRIWNGSFSPNLNISWWFYSPKDSEKYALRAIGDFTLTLMPKASGYSVRCVKDN